MGQEEELPAVAKMVGAATAQLVAASRAKSAAGSKSHSNLSDAAKVSHLIINFTFHLLTSAQIVAQATSQLVSAAKAWNDLKEEETEQEMAGNYTGSAVKQLEQQMKVLKLEKELEKARKAMLNQRKAEYEKK